MPLSRRYLPEKDPGESCVFGMDFSAVVPPGVGIQSGQLAIQTNTATPTDDKSWTIGTVSVLGRVLYAPLSGGKAGTDYRLIWTATDSDGNIWPRTALCLCAPTS